MMNEHTAATKNFMTIREREWTYKDRRGRVEALMPIHGMTPFCELAVLAPRDAKNNQFAARVVGTEDWVHFQYLQRWMLPIVEEYLAMSGRYQQIAELVARTHRLTQ